MANPKGNLATLTAPRFEPGRSGNPSGRPRKVLTEKLDAYLDQPTPADKRKKKKRTHADRIVQTTVRLAERGNVSAIREVFDRVEGKVAQRTELSGPSGAAIPLTLPEVDRRLLELLEKARSRAR